MKFLFFLFTCAIALSDKKRKNNERKPKDKGSRSRALTDFLIMRENGEAEYNNFPVFFAKERIKRGELKQKNGSGLGFLSKFKKLITLKY